MPIPPHFSRRQFFKRSCKGLAAAGALTAGYANLYERKHIVMEKVTIAIPGLASALDGFRIGHLTDIHYETFTGPGLLNEALDLLEGMNPDMVALTGDYVTGRPDPVDECAPMLGRLRPPYGIFACLGNHDYAQGGKKKVLQGLRAAGIQALYNQGESAGPGGAIWMAGIASFWRGKPNLAASTMGCPNGSAVILLAHEPDYADLACNDQRVRLQLSGHSHGGQVRLPLLGAIRTPTGAKKYIAGKYAVRDLQLYVNRGLGCTGLPFRFLCPPEITEITLRSV